MNKKGPKKIIMFLLIFCSVASALIALFSGFMGLFLAAMGSDAPGSTANVGYWIFAAGIIFLPPTIILGLIVTSWIFYSKDKFIAAVITGFVPLFLAFLAIIYIMIA